MEWIQLILEIVFRFSNGMGFVLIAYHANKDDWEFGTEFLNQGRIFKLLNTLFWLMLIWSPNSGALYLVIVLLLSLRYKSLSHGYNATHEIVSTFSKAWLTYVCQPTGVKIAATGKGYLTQRDFVACFPKQSEETAYRVLDIKSSFSSEEGYSIIDSLKNKKSDFKA